MPLRVIDACGIYLPKTQTSTGRSHAGAEGHRKLRRRPAGVAGFIGAQVTDSIIIVRGATEAVYLVAGAYSPTAGGTGDEVLVSGLEHHANIVPWQLLCRKTGGLLRTIPVDNSGRLDMAAYRRLLSQKVKIVAVAHVSNVLGTVAPVAEVIALAHRTGAAVLLDGAQAVSHMPVVVSALDCEFYVFS
jgi:cysteine desulfurase/selenocysteine lyase